MHIVLVLVHIVEPPQVYAARSFSKLNLILLTLCANSLRREISLSKMHALSRKRATLLHPRSCTLDRSSRQGNRWICIRKSYIQPIPETTNEFTSFYFPHQSPVIFHPAPSQNIMPLPVLPPSVILCLHPLRIRICSPVLPPLFVLQFRSFMNHNILYLSIHHQSTKQLTIQNLYKYF